MEDKKKLLSFISCLCFVLVFFSCTQEDNEMPRQTNTVQVQFDCTKSSFGSATRASDDISVWKNNDIVFLYQSYNKYIECIYKNNKWTADLSNADINIGTKYCICRHFANYAEYSNDYVKLNNQSVDFVNNYVQYRFDGKVLNINADLRLHCSRIRFKGSSGEKVSVTGLTTPSGYYPSSDNLLTEVPSEIALTVQSDGYTPYIYGIVGTSTVLKITYSGKTFEKAVSSSILPLGKSAYIVLSELNENPQNIGADFVLEDYDSDSCIDEIVYSISTDKNSLSFGYNPTSSQYINITSNDSWTVTSKPTWCTVTPTSGTGDGKLTVSVSANSQPKKNEGQIIIKGTNSGKTVTISVIQDAAPYTLSVDVKSLTFEAKPTASKYINITSNESWTISLSSTLKGCVVSPTSGTGNAKLTVTLAENTATSKNEGYINITGVNSGNVISISISQEEGGNTSIDREDFPDDDNLNK